MIVTGLPGSAITSAEIMGVPFDARTVGSITIERSEDAHDAATLVVNGLHPKAVTAYLDQPVRVTVAVSTHIATTFVGYVNHIDPESSARYGQVNSSPIQQATVYCLGASRDMRGKRTHVWENYSLPELVRTLALRYRYSFAVPNDPMRTRFLQRSESDFELLVTACRDLGYRVTIHGTHIHVWDPLKALGRGLPSTVLSSPVGTNGVRHRDREPGRIIEMTGTFGTSGYQGDAHSKRVSFLDYDGHSFSIATHELDDHRLARTGRSVRSQFEDEYVITADSYAHARRRLASEAKDNYPFHATLQVVGVPFLVPGSMVEVSGYDGYYDGLWLVRSVKHSVVRDNYVSELEVSRNTTNEMSARLPAVAIAGPPPGSNLVDGAWNAALRTEDIYV